MLGLFFITIGMSLDWHIVLERWVLIGVLLLLPLAFKLARLFDTRIEEIFDDGFEEGRNGRS